MRYKIYWYIVLICNQQRSAEQFVGCYCKHCLTSHAHIKDGDASLCHNPITITNQPSVRQSHIKTPVGMFLPVQR